MNRRGYIGGSTVAAILGISPGRWSSPWSQWAQIVGLRPAQEDNERFAIGRDLEAGLALAFTRTSGLHVAAAQQEIVHHRWPFFRGHIDGLAFESAASTEPLGVVEHKTQFGAPWDDVPAHYQAQAQFYLWLTGLERCWFSVLFGGFRYEVYELKADRSDQALIAWRAWRFWRDHVLTGNPPDTDGSQATLDALAEVYPEHTPATSVELDDEARGALASYEEAAREIKRWAMRRDRARAHLEATLGVAEEGCVDGVRVCSWRSQHRDAYTVAESNFRVFRTHTSKKENAT